MTTPASVPATAPAATTKRWIIRNDYRRCRNYSCSGHESSNAKVVIDADGAIRATCRACGDVAEGQASSYKARLPCKRCSWVRDVTVRLYSTGPDTPPKEAHEPHCSICLMELSAARHEATAREFRQRARMLKAARAGKGGGG